MRLFGKISHIIRFSRNVSCRTTAYQGNFLLYGPLQKRHALQDGVQFRFYTQKPSNVFSLNSGTNMLRKRISFSGTPGIIKNENNNVLPVGVINTSDGSKDGGFKVLVIPLNMAGSDDQVIKNTINSLNIIHKHAGQIEAFAELMSNTEMAEMQPEIDNIQVSENNSLGTDRATEDDMPDYVDPTELVTHDELGFWESYKRPASDVNAIGKVADESIVGNAMSSHALYETADSEKSISEIIASAESNIPETEWSHVETATFQVPKMPQIQPEPKTPFTEPLTQPPQTKPAPLEEENIPPPITADVVPSTNMETDEDVQEIYALVPDGLEERLNQLAISSMQLAFEMDMTNIRDAIMRDANSSHLTLSELSNKDICDPTVSISTNVEVEASEIPEHTVPLNFNALIRGTVEIDASKLSLESLDDLKIPEFNDNITSIAANICSTALQKGFPSQYTAKPFEFTDTLYPVKDEVTADSDKGSGGDTGRIALQKCRSAQRDDPCRENACVNVDEEMMTHDKSTMKIAHKREMCAATVPNPKEAVEDQSSMKQKVQLKDGCKHPPLKKKKKCKKTCPLGDPCKEEKTCPKPKKCDKKAKSASSTQSITASKGGCDGGKKKDPCAKDKKKEDSCGKDKKKKEDPCAKFKKKDDGCKKDKDKKKDPCGKDKKKEDPCAKFKKKKEDPCKKKEDPCKKKEDTCKKKEDPCKKKEDPCKKKEDPCKKKEDSCKKKEDPCGKDKKKKEDPCAKFKKKKEDGCKKDKKKDPCGKDKKKEDPCAKFKKKDDGCKKDKDKKKDPCGKDKKKEDPCAKFKKKEDPCAKKKDDCKKKEDPCKKKEDPCKKKEDPCKKKEDPCKKKKDPCKKKEDPCKKKKDPCKKDKKDPCGNDKKKDPCGKDKKKEDPCAKFKKKKDPCAKKDDKKKDDKKKDPCGKDKKKKDPCAKFKKDDKKKDCAATRGMPIPKVAISNKHMHKKLILCPRNLNPIIAAGVGSNTVKKCFSTISLGNIFNEALSAPISEHVVNYALLPKFPTYSMYTRRHYASKKTGGGGKCDTLKAKFPKNRKPDGKARTGLRTDCYEDSEECPKPRCNKECKKIKKPRKKCDKENKHFKAVSPSLWNLWFTKTFRQVPIVNQQRCYTVDLANQNLITDEQQCDRVIDRNEIIKIPDSYKIQRVYEPFPVAKDYDVLIRTGSIAITGSDIHVFENGSKGCEGMTLGHDATGFIEKVGRCIHHLHVGDRVVMESALSCGICEFCKRGVYNMCAQLVYNGFFGTHQIHPADLCYKLPDAISMEEGALTQTLALGCQACFKANIMPTTNVLIIGSCPTAVAAALCAKAIGAKNVVIASTMQCTLEDIKSDFGFEYVHFDSNALFGEVLECIYAKFKNWPNSVINCAISAMTMNLAVMALQPCGVCVLTECETECASFNALDILMKNIRMVPSFRSTNMFPTALQLMKSDRAPMHRFISTSYPWKSLEDAFKCAQHEANTGAKKVVVNCSED